MVFQEVGVGRVVPEASVANQTESPSSDAVSFPLSSLETHHCRLPRQSPSTRLQDFACLGFGSAANVLDLC